MSDAAAPARAAGGHAPSWIPTGGPTVLALTCAALLLAAAALLLSFRAPFSPALALAANLDRAMAAAAAGMALSLSALLAEEDAGRSALFEPALFAASVGASGGLVLGWKLIGGAMAAAGLGVVGALALAAAVHGLDRLGRPGNLLLLAGLALGLVVAVPTALAAATEVGRGELALWLLGSVSHASGPGAALALAASAGLVVAVLARGGAVGRSARRTGLGALCFGLGVGVAGPVAFLGGFSALVARTAAGAASARSRVLLAAAWGAALLLAADAAGRLSIGGYAPPLNVTIAVVAIPGFILWNRAQLCARESRRHSARFAVFEGVAILGGTLAMVWVAARVVVFARSAF